MDKNWSSSRRIKTSWGPGQIICIASFHQPNWYMDSEGVCKHCNYWWVCFKKVTYSSGLPELKQFPIYSKPVGCQVGCNNLGFSSGNQIKEQGLWNVASPLSGSGWSSSPCSPAPTQAWTVPWHLLSSNALRLGCFCSPHFSTSAFPSPCYLHNHEKWADRKNISIFSLL